MVHEVFYFFSFFSAVIMSTMLFPGMPNTGVCSAVNFQTKAQMSSSFCFFKNFGISNYDPSI